MTRLNWTEESDRVASMGVSAGVVYFRDRPALPWNGLISCTEIPDDEESDPAYLDGQRLPHMSERSETFSLAVQAFTYPDEVLTHPVSAVSYSTKLGNRTEIHVVYNPIFEFDDLPYMSLGDEVEPVTFSATLLTTPITIPGMAPSSHVIFQLDTVSVGWFVEMIEGYLYGTATADPVIPDISDLISWFAEVVNHAHLLIIDHGNGTFSAVGPDAAVHAVNGTEYEIDASSIAVVDAGSYTISSY